MLESAAHIAVIAYVTAMLVEFAMVHYTRARTRKRMSHLINHLFEPSSDNSELN